MGIKPLKTAQKKPKTNVFGFFRPRVNYTIKCNTLQKNDSSYKSML